MKTIYVACKFLECRYIGEWEKDFKSIAYCRKSNKELNDIINCSNCIETKKRKK